MADPSDLPGDVGKALEGISEATRRAETHQANRVQAVSLILAGLTYEQVAERLKISPQGARDMVHRTLTAAENRNVEELRALENARLDRAQAAIWSQVLEGNGKAVDTYLRISRQRALINGLNAPTRIDMSISVRQEMEQALSTLEELVLEAEVVEVDGDDLDG